MSAGVMLDMPKLTDTFGDLFAERTSGLEKFSIDNFEPRFGRVLIAECKPEQFAGEQGKIFIPDQFQNRRCVGVVIAVNPKQAEDMPKGTVVVYGSDCGEKMPIGGRADLILLTYAGRPEDDILGVIRTSD